MLEREFQYYLDHQSELVAKYNGKILVIVDNQIIGAFSTNQEAYSAGMSKAGAGKFLIQKCSPGNADYTQTFYSRVHFQ